MYMSGARVWFIVVLFALALDAWLSGLHVLVNEMDIYFHLKR